MEEVNVKIINIYWDKIDFSEKDDRLARFNEIDSMNKEKDYGIYQIYGNHQAYGRDVLLYIGKAQDQTFAARFNGAYKWQHIGSTSTPTSIRLGRIVLQKENHDNWNAQIELSETILIKGHSPALNQKENKGLFSKDGIAGCHYLIINWGDYGQLQHEVSTLGTSEKYWNDV